MNINKLLYDAINLRRQTLDQLDRCTSPAVAEMLRESLADLDEAIAEFREQGAVILG